MKRGIAFKLTWMAVLVVGVATSTAARSDGQGLKERATIEAHSVIYDERVLREYFEPYSVWIRKQGTVAHEPPRSVTCLAFSPDSKLLASGSQDNFPDFGPRSESTKKQLRSRHNTIKLWNVISAKKIANLEGNKDVVVSMAFSRDSKTLISASMDTVINIWDVEDCKIVRGFGTKTDKQEKLLNSMASSADGKTLATTQGVGEILLWNVSTGSVIRDFRGRAAKVNCLEFSPDERMLVSANSDHTIALWEVKSGQQRALLDTKDDAVTRVAFSPDSKLLASGAYRTLKLWDTSTCKELMLLKEVRGSIDCLAFSPNGYSLAAGGGSEPLKLWDLRTGKSAIVFEAKYVVVCSVAFSPDGKTLAAGFSDGTIKLWDVPAKVEAK